MFIWLHSIKSMVNSQDCLFFFMYAPKNNWIPICTYISHILIWFNMQGHFRASLSVSVFNSGQPANCARKCHIKLIRHNLHNYTQTCFTHHNTLLHTCTIHHIKIFLWQPVICAGKYCTKQNFRHIHNFRHTRFTHHHTLIHTTTFLYQYGSIKKQIPSSQIICTLVGSKSSWFKHKFPIHMAAYIVDILPYHQRNLLFLLFSCDIEGCIEYFLLWSNILTLTCNFYT